MAAQPSLYPLDPARTALGQRLHQALQGLLPDGGQPSLNAEQIARLLEQPPEAAMGDYALPCFRFAKETKLKPQDVASTLAAKLNPEGWLAGTKVVGAFLNLVTNKEHLAAAVLKDLAQTLQRTSQRPENHLERVMVEYSQPNTHKEFHVGHGRNVCLGNSIVRLYRHCGYQVIGANYFGDDGTHIATVLWHLRSSGQKAPQTARGEWLGAMYVEAKRRLADASDDERTAMVAAISKVHRDMETKTGDVFTLWRETRQWSLDDFASIYQWLDVKFDELFYESDLSEPAQQLVDDYTAKGVFKLDQGAIGVDLKDYKLGFCILRKRDGNTLYATKDLALARVKFEKYQITRNVYVVADEQNHHFKQVFKVLELMGFAQAKQCHHLSYGLVVLPEGKMSSRDGTAVSFLQLRDAMMTHLLGVLKKYDGDWSAEEIASTAHRLCDGALKYGMISTDPVSKIVFNLDDWLSFEGNSGPYLMYADSRTRSILRKAKEQGFVPSGAAYARLTAPAEHELMRFIYDFGAVTAAACEGLKPSLVATHIYAMCRAFNRFYVEVPVLKAEDAELRDARLALIAAFSTTLNQGLSLLGITPPDRM